MDPKQGAWADAVEDELKFTRWGPQAQHTIPMPCSVADMSLRGHVCMAISVHVHVNINVKIMLMFV